MKAWYSDCSCHEWWCTPSQCCGCCGCVREHGPERGRCVDSFPCLTNRMGDVQDPFNSALAPAAKRPVLTVAQLEKERVAGP